MNYSCPQCRRRGCCSGSRGALKRHLPAAIAGDDIGVHQARVASRRLREAVPVLSTGLKGSKAGKAHAQDPALDAGARHRARARRHAAVAR